MFCNVFFCQTIWLEIHAPVVPSSATPPPWLSKPHAPRPTLRSYRVFNLTTRKRSRTIDHVSAEICVFLIGQLFNSKSSTCLAIFCNGPPLWRTNPTSHVAPSRGFNSEPPKRSTTIDRATGEFCHFLSGKLFNLKRRADLPTPATALLYEIQTPRHTPCPPVTST